MITMIVLHEQLRNASWSACDLEMDGLKSSYAGLDFIGCTMHEGV
jgi:hypothetical protein